MSTPTQPSLGAARTDPASNLTYRILEQSSNEPPQALLLLLHGVGGNELQMAALASGLDSRIQTVLVRGPLAFGPSQFGWFQVSFGDQGPSINAQQAESSRQQLLQLVSSLQCQYALNAAHTLVAGFSQGGIMSAGLALTAPQQVTAFGLLSGRILPEIAPRLAAPEQLQKVQGYISHGHYDDKLPVSWAEKADTWLNELSVPHQVRLYPAGHELTHAMVEDFRQWASATLLGV